MKQVYLLPVFLGAAFSMGAAHSPTPTSIEEVGPSSFASDFSVVRQDTIVTKQDTAKVACVREDNLKMKKKVPAAKTSRVIMKREVKQASLKKQSTEGNLVDVIVMQSGRVLRNLEDMQLAGSNGNHISSNNFVGFENIVTPFEGTVRFRATNQMGTTTYDREVRFTVV